MQVQRRILLSTATNSIVHPLTDPISSYSTKASFNSRWQGLICMADIDTHQDQVDVYQYTEPHKAIALSNVFSPDTEHQSPPSLASQIHRISYQDKEFIPRTGRLSEAGLYLHLSISGRVPFADNKARFASPMYTDNFHQGQVGVCFHTKILNLARSLLLLLKSSRPQYGAPCPPSPSPLCWSAPSLPRIRNSFKSTDPLSCLTLILHGAADPAWIRLVPSRASPALRQTKGFVTTYSLIS